MQGRLDPETDVNMPFENVLMSGAYLELFSGRGLQSSSLFKRSFFDRFNFKQLKQQKRL